jgi:hypothetical protein
VFTPFYTWVVRNVSGNGQETFLEIFCPVSNLSQWNLWCCYVFKKCKFTAVNKCLLRKIPESFPGEISSGEKFSGKYFWQFWQISAIFSDRISFRKIPGKLVINFNHEKYDLPAVNTCYMLCIRIVSDVSGNFRETFWQFFATWPFCHKVIYAGVTCCKKCKFTTVHECFVSKNSGKFPGENFLQRKIHRKVFW